MSIKNAKKDYTDKFKRNIVKMYLRGKNGKSLRTKYNVPKSTFYYWVEEYKKLFRSNGTIITKHDFNNILLENNRIKKLLEIYSIIGCSPQSSKTDKLNAIKKYKAQYPITAVYLNILFYAQRTHEYTQNAILYIQSLMRENVFDEAAKEAKRCLDTTLYISRETEIEILLLFFTCLGAMNMIGNSKYDPYWKKLENVLCLCNDFSVERIKYTLLKWEKYFFAGNFEEALSVIKPYYDEIERVPFDIKNDYVGQVIQDYALTIKEQSTGENALEIFENAIKKFPQSFYPVIQKYSQLGNAALKHNPYQAEKYYRQLIKTAQGTNFPWQGKLHAKIDIVMSMVLDYVKPDCRHHEANEILKYIEQYIAEAEQTNINCQKGRALILKAVMYIAKNDFNSAERLLHSANLYLFDTQSNIYRWRAQFSLASLLINTNGDSIQLRQLLASITNTLLMHFACKVREDKASVVRQVLLASCMYYHQINDSETLNKILREINDKDFEHDFKRLLSVENWQRTMQSKVMYVNNILVAVG